MGCPNINMNTLKTKVQRITIRYANITDLPKIITILNQAIDAQVNGILIKETVESKLKWFREFDINTYPIYVAVLNKHIVGFCYLSPYRRGRQAMSKVAEISYYVDYNHHLKQVGSTLMKYAIKDCKRLKKNSLLAILLDNNTSSISLLEKYNFKKWGHFPDIINLNKKVCGQYVYGLKIG